RKCLPIFTGSVDVRRLRSDDVHPRHGHPLPPARRERTASPAPEAFRSGRGRDEQAATIAGTLPVGVAPLFAPPPDPRYNLFDWETWHELDFTPPRTDAALR